MKSVSIALAMLIFYVAPVAGQQFSLSDYYSGSPELGQKVDSVFSSLSPEQQVGQMLITSAGRLGYPDSKVFSLVAGGKAGSVIYLRDKKENHAKRSFSIDSLAAANGQLPVLISMDAEPSLINGRIEGIRPIVKTSEILNSKQSDSIARLISRELVSIGVHHNYAPVCDISTSNAAITNRSYGDNADSIIALSKAFIVASQESNIAAMAKHFPGHGLVHGDTHHQTVFIDGELMELPVYKPLIDAGVISVMVGHMTIKNNPAYDTGGMPASLNRRIVTELLKDSLGFKGIVMTDALNNMKAVSIYENSSLLAAKAGNDMLCMPADEEKAIEAILAYARENEVFKEQIHESVKKVIRLKICLGLL
jgi:beta-N-acetylhexosaminidase